MGGAWGAPAAGAARVGAHAWGFSLRASTRAKKEGVGSVLRGMPGHAGGGRALPAPGYTCYVCVEEKGARVAGAAGGCEWKPPAGGAPKRVALSQHTYEDGWRRWRVQREGQWARSATGGRRRAHKAWPQAARGRPCRGEAALASGAPQAAADKGKVAGAHQSMRSQHETRPCRGAAALAGGTPPRGSMQFEARGRSAAPRGRAWGGGRA